jgi:hypothetical protein
MPDATKPQRAWRIGDKYFDSYEQVVEYRKTNRRHSQLEELTNFIDACFHDMEEPNARPLAENILENYSIKKLYR